MTFVNEKIEDGKWQTIDRERDIILSKVSGPNIEGLYNCELRFQQQLIRFSGYSQETVHGKPMLGEENIYDINWHVLRLNIPEAIQHKKKYILEAIEESLKARGWDFKPEKACSVSVEFNTSVL